MYRVLWARNWKLTLPEDLSWECGNAQERHLGQQDPFQTGDSMSVFNSERDFHQDNRAPVSLEERLIEPSPRRDQRPPTGMRLQSAIYLGRNQIKKQGGLKTCVCQLVSWSRQLGVFQKKKVN